MLCHKSMHIVALRKILKTSHFIILINNNKSIKDKY